LFLPLYDHPFADDDLEVLGLRRRADDRGRKNRRASQSLRETLKRQNKPHFPHSFLKTRRR
jgi:hypothetical protein